MTDNTHAEVTDVFAGMGLSEGEAAGAAAKIQAIQKGKLARRQIAAKHEEAAIVH